MQNNSASVIQQRMALIKHKVLILSGKGGVGKSTCALQLATTLALEGKQVGLLDIDICGPSIPTMTGRKGSEVIQNSNGWNPIKVNDNLQVMSIGFLLANDDDPVVWRGPRKTGMIMQFLAETNFGELDFLIIDTPPGTSDEHLAMVQGLAAAQPDGAVIVTTPQDVALMDVRKEISFARKMNLRTLGLIENMCGFACPDCEHTTYIFGRGGGQKLADEAGMPFLGRIPLDAALAESEENGSSFMEAYPESATAKAWKSVAANITTSL